MEAAQLSTDERADATPFIQFMLHALHDAVRQTIPTDQVTDQATDQVAELIRTIGSGEWTGHDVMEAWGLSH